MVIVPLGPAATQRGRSEPAAGVMAIVRRAASVGFGPNHGHGLGRADAKRRGGAGLVLGNLGRSERQAQPAAPQRLFKRFHAHRAGRKQRAQPAPVRRGDSLRHDAAAIV
jgi:hypothetical protein